MALDAAHRSSIYRKLLPVLGDEDAHALMSEFSAVEVHELVTKDFLRAELRAETGSLRADMAALETRLTTRLGVAIGASTALLGAIGLLT